MRRKYFKNKNDEWAFVSISDDEEKKLIAGFIDEYIEIIELIEAKLGKKEQRYVQMVFDKIASPAHYKFEEILEKKRDALIEQKNLRENY